MSKLSRRSAAVAAVVAAVLAGMASTASGAPAAQVDQCLVGTWRSDPVETAAQPPSFNGLTGLGNVTLSFTADGIERVEYGTSTPKHQPEPNGDLVYSYTGSAEAPVTIANGGATSGGVRSSDVVETITDQSGLNPPQQQPKTKGPVFLGAIPGQPYRCGSDELTFGGEVEPVITMRRVGGPLPQTQEKPGTGAVPPPASSSTSSASSSNQGGADDDGGLLPFLLGGALLVAVAGGLVWWTRSRPKKDDERDVDVDDDDFDEPMVPVDVVRSDPCDCSCTMEVTGPDRLYLCDCADPIWHLRPIAQQDLGEGQTMDSMDQAVLDKSIVLVVKVPDGSKCPRNRPNNVLFNRLYQAPVTSTCHNGGHVTKVDRQWTIDSSAFRKGQDSPVVIKATAVVTVTCPNGTHTVTITAERTTSMRPAKPHVYVILNDPPASMEPPHAGVRIECGEFDRIYGFYPKERAGLTTVVPGGGQVKVLGRDHVLPDFERIDDYYETSRKTIFEVPVTCEQIGDVQDYWERLRANPGRYGLLNNNCAVQALKSVEQLLPPLPANASIFDKTPTLSPPGAITLLETLGLKEVVTPAKAK